MLIKLATRITHQDFLLMRDTKDSHICLDVKDIDFLTSKDISTLLELAAAGKNIELANANEHIITTIKVLKVEDLIKIKMKKAEK